jgi:hypothetical protein
MCIEFKERSRAVFASLQHQVVQWKAVCIRVRVRGEGEVVRVLREELRSLSTSTLASSLLK